MAKLESRWYEVGGLRMHARVGLGPVGADLPPVVLVHGLVVSSAYMMPVARRLGASFRVHAPDLPGFGLSDKPPRPLSLSELADALAAWIDVAGLPPAVMVGNSFGCQIAVEHALRHPEQVDRLVLQGPTVDPSAPGVVRQLGRWLRNAPREPPSLAVPIAIDYARAGTRQALATARTMVRDHIEEKAPRIDRPTLIVAGARDPIAPPRWARSLASRMPDARWSAVPGKAHTLVFTAPDALEREIRAFVLGVPVSALEPPPRPAPRFVATFDSATAMLRATTRVLQGEDFPGLGLDPWWGIALPAANLVPPRLREKLYRLAGWLSAIPRRGLWRVDADDLRAWAADGYLRRPYPAVLVGASNGAAVHLAAALGAPWLPQTFLVPVRRWGADVVDMAADMEWGRRPGAALLAGNPDLQLHHMHDPNQDQLMSAHMAYFRVKVRRLGPAYERFLRDALAPGGTIFVLDCRQRWPAVRVAERHWFQPGAVGGLTPREYLEGGPRVEAFLRRRGIDPGRWRAPVPDDAPPEAEWGFEPALARDVERFARRHGYRVRRVVFDQPVDLSPLVADLYRDWYGRRGLPADRLLVESFILMEPWWALRTARVPFWTHFPVDAAAEALERYLGAAAPFAEAHAMLFSHGVDSVGLARPERWRALLAHAAGRAGLIGVDERAFPRDFGALVRYHAHLRRRVRARHRPPAPLGLDDLDAFLARTSGRYRVRWLEIHDTLAPGRARPPPG